MFNFCKPKGPKVTWWSDIENLEKICPPVPARQFIPEWFKKIKASEYGDRSNVKLCPSFMQYFSMGWVMPLWCDLQMGIDSVGNVFWESPHAKFRFEFHREYQYKNHLPQKEQDQLACVIKPISPWHVKISKGWSLLQLPMTYYFNDDWYVLTGIIPASIWHETNHQIIIKKNFFKGIKPTNEKHDSGNIKRIIPKGTPLAQYIPIPDDYTGEVVEETEELKELEDTAHLMIGQKFTKRYATMTKCPYVKK